MPACALAAEFSISKQQLSDIKKFRGKLARAADTFEEDVASHRRKSMKPAKDDVL